MNKDELYKINALHNTLYVFIKVFKRYFYIKNKYKLLIKTFEIFQKYNKLKIVKANDNKFVK